MKKVKHPKKHRVLSDDGKVLKKRRVVKFKTRRFRALIIIGIIILFLLLAFAGFNLLLYLIEVI